jgi:hypothetical protein
MTTFSQEECQPGLLFSNVNGTLTCIKSPYLSENDACDPSSTASVCRQPGLGCIDGRCTPVSSREGDTCTWACFAEGLVCGASGTCERVGGPGHTCSTQLRLWGSECQDELICEQVDPGSPGHCRFRYLDGETCYAAWTCASPGSVCIQTPPDAKSTCRPPAGPCELCNDNRDCGAGMGCDPASGRCRKVITDLPDAGGPACEGQTGGFIAGSVEFDPTQTCP